MKQNSGTAF